MIKDHSEWHTWKGGKHKLKKGHVRVYCEDGKYRLEHRVLMELHLGRKLKKNEIVHHINGIPDDNRIENLQVMTNAEHSALHSKDKNYPKVPSTCHPDRLVYKPGLCSNCKRIPRSKRYVEKNKEMLADKRKIYYEKNADKIRERSRDYESRKQKKPKTPEQLARSRELYALNIEKIRERKRAQYHKNKERTNPIRNKRRRKSLTDPFAK